MLERWVEQGGLLLLITDHAPMGSAAEALGGRFGVDMSKGATIDESHSAEGRPAALVFSQANKLLGDHAITRGRDPSERISRVQTFTGQSLKGPPGSTSHHESREHGRRSHGWQGSLRGRPVAGAGFFPIGMGRVVVLGEAAMLSAQVAGDGDFKMGMNFGGIDNKQLALSTSCTGSRGCSSRARPGKKGGLSGEASRGVAIYSCTRPAGRHRFCLQYSEGITGLPVASNSRLPCRPRSSAVPEPWPGNVIRP